MQVCPPSERDELGHVTRYEYADGLHPISRRINADGTQVKYRYDNARLLLTDIKCCYALSQSQRSIQCNSAGDANI